jgi:predicted ArsR family transcriptional regulator
MAQDLDLFGNPYDPAGRKQGRPEHQPSEENIITIMVLLASGMTNGEIAKTIGISVPTLRKHYLHLTRHREVMLGRLKGKLRTAQIREGLKGNAAALSGALKMLDAVSAENAHRDLQNRAANQPGRRGYVSKKEQRLDRARSIGGKYAVPPAPRLVSNNGQAVAAAQPDEE